MLIVQFYKQKKGFYARPQASEMNANGDKDEIRYSAVKTNLEKLHRPLIFHTRN